MKGLAWCALLCACAAAPPREGHMTEPTTDIDAHIQTLLQPSGDPQYRATRDEALGWLLAHADAAHPRLLAYAEAPEPPDVLLEVLARFGRPESVPVLARALNQASDPTTVAAAQALARHPAPSARSALEQALASPRDQVVASAAGGLAARGDRGACPALDGARGHANAEVRGRIEEARAALGCK